MHALGYFKNELTSREKQHFLSVLEVYRLRKIALSAASAIVRSWIIRFEAAYLQDQTFFNPFPEELMSLHDSARQ